MKQRLISDIESQMQKMLDNSQLEELHRVLVYCMHMVDISNSNSGSANEVDVNYVQMFLAAKKIEGRSEKSLKYYQSTIEKMVEKIGKAIKHITTDDLRRYLSEYQQDNNSSKVTIDNIRRSCQMQKYTMYRLNMLRYPHKILRLHYLQYLSSSFYLKPMYLTILKLRHHL